jgi:hypothetical protein
LPEPTSPWSSRSIGGRPGEVVADRRPWRVLVGRQLDGAPTRAPSASTGAPGSERRPPSSSAICGRRVADPLAAPLDHPELEREQLVERQPPERGVAPSNESG